MTPAYRFDELGWLQFERVCSLLLSTDIGSADVRWAGHADAGRVTVLDRRVTSATNGLQLEGPVTVIVVWVAEGDSEARRLISLTERVAGLGSGAVRPQGLGSQPDPRAAARVDLGGALPRIPDETA